MTRVSGSSAFRPRVILATALALVLAWLVLLAASWNLGTVNSKAASLTLFPEDPELTYARAMSDLQESGGAEGLPGILSSVDGAAYLHPLDARPLSLHALDKLLEDPSAPPVPLLEAARQRNPRLVEARLLLFEAYGRSDRGEDALAEAQSLSVLMPGERGMIVRLSAGLARFQDRADRGNFGRALAGSSLNRDVLRRLVASGVSGAEILEFAEGMRGVARDPAQRQGAASAVEALLGKRDLVTARALWAVLYDTDIALAGAALADPELGGEDATPPFSWRLSSGRVGLAEFREGGLEIYTYGRRSGVLAGQLLMLAPGKYRLASVVSSVDGRVPDGFSWRVVCMQKSRALIDLRLSAFAADGTAPDADFVIPETGCSAQYLRLTGGAGEQSRSQSARIENVTLERVPE